MRGVRWVVYLWPGLADLWWRGAWSGLALACAFAMLLNLVVAATLVWNELLGTQREMTMWAGFVAGWLALLFVSMRTSPRINASHLTGAADVFPAARGEYLKGNWLEAELMARELIGRIPADIEAHLLLSAVLRHTNRFDEARECLDAVQLWDRASAWRLEIGREYELLSAKENRLAEQEKASPPSPLDGGDEQTEHKVLENDETTISLPVWRHAA